MGEFERNSQADKEKRELRRRPVAIKIPAASATPCSQHLSPASKYVSLLPVHQLLRTEDSLGSVTSTQGAFASVRAVTELHSGLRFAAKIADIADSTHLQKAIREYEILWELNHPAIVKVVKLIIDESSMKSYMLMPIESQPSLTTVLEASGTLSLRQVRELARELFDALVYLHNRNVIHRDINPNNVLYSVSDVKLIDFNTARRLYPGQNLVNSVGTHSFKPPEMQAGLPYDHKADVWSLSATLMKALGRSTDDNYEDLGLEAADFFTRTLAKEPDSRLSAREAHEHTWLHHS